MTENSSTGNMTIVWAPSRFMLDQPRLATPKRLSLWQQIIEYLKVLYR